MNALGEKLVLNGTNGTAVLDETKNIALCVSEEDSTYGFGRSSDTGTLKAIVNDTKDEQYQDSVILPREDICNTTEICESGNISTE